MKFKSSAVDLTTFLAPRILSEGLFLYLEDKKGTKLLKNLFHNFIQYINCFIFHVLCDVGVDGSSDFRVGMTNPVRDCF